MTFDLRRRPPAHRRLAIARAGLASLKTLAACEGPISQRANSFIEAVRDHLLQVEVDLDTLEPLEAEGLARLVPEPEWRERILRGMTILSLLDGPATTVRAELLEQTASALGVDPGPARTFREITQERFRAVQIDIARRGFIRQAAKAYVQEEGLRGIFEVASSVLGHEDPKLAARYRTLDSFPVGTFGRAYATFIERNEFSYPGELGGPPPPVMRHDCCHVLGDYGTTPAEECAVVSFQAGFEQADPFYVMLFAIAQFEIGIGSSPFLPGLTGRADPARMLEALEHGTHVNTDLIGDPAFDPWEEFAKPLPAVREKFGVPPRGRAPEYPAS